MIRRQLKYGILVTLACAVPGAVLWYGLGGAARSNTAQDVEAPGATIEAVRATGARDTLVGNGATESTREVVGLEYLSANPAVYVVLHPEGTPVVKASCMLFTANEILVESRTDQAGEFELDNAREGMARLLINASGWRPQVQEVSLESGRHVVVLQQGSVVSGWVLLDGQVPGGEVPLSLASYGSLLPLEEDSGLDQIRFGLSLEAGRSIVVTTDDAGLFKFSGLPVDWKGELRLPLEYRLEDQTLACGSHALNCFALDGPAEDLTIRVVKCLTLRGRVVDCQKRDPVPVPGAVVLPDLIFPEGFERVYLGEAIADAEGRFAIVLPTPSILGGGIHISPPGREFFREIEVEPVEVEDVLDLGDVPLIERSETEAVSLRVVDEDLDPIQGAVGAIDSSSPPSEPTDESGHTTLRGVVPGATAVTVYARGYETAEISVPFEVPAELSVVLRPGTLLEFRFLEPDGKVARGITARLSAREHPLRVERSPRSYRAYTQTGCSYYKTFFPRDGGVVVRLHDLGEGRIVLNDIKPGLVLQLRVEGPFAGVIQEETIVALQPGEHRVQEVLLKRFAARLHGRVLDQAGEPMPRATVSITSARTDSPVPGAGTFGKSVDTDGNFEFKAIYSSSVWFTARAPGYTNYIVEELEVPEEGAFLEVRLAPENVVTVTIEDENGKRLPASSVRGSLLSGAGVALAKKAAGQDGVYILRSLPEEEITITAYVYGIPYSQSHNPREPKCSITVPALGEIRVKAHFFDELVVDDTWLLCLIPRWEAGPGIRYVRVRDSIILGVLPGSYDIVMRRYPRGFEEMEHFLEVSNRVHIEVRAGGSTHVEILQRM